MDFKGKEVFKGENMAEIAQKSKELSSSIKSVSNLRWLKRKSPVNLWSIGLSGRAPGRTRTVDIQNQSRLVVGSRSYKARVRQAYWRKVCGPANTDIISIRPLLGHIYLLIPYLFIPNRSLGPIGSGDVKVFGCSPESKECLPLIHGSHKM